MSFWDIITFIFVSFLFIAYLIILFQIIGDLFRNHEMGGFVKALWVLFLIVAWWFAALIYLIVYGKGMAQRQQDAMVDMKNQQDAYIKQVAGSSSTDQIAQAKSLLDSGAITQAEFDSLKAKALA